MERQFGQKLEINIVFSLSYNPDLLQLYYSSPMLATRKELSLVERGDLEHWPGFQDICFIKNEEAAL